MLKQPNPPRDATRRVFPRRLLIGLLLAAIVQAQMSAVEVLGTATIPLDPATPTVNTLDLELAAVGSVVANFGFGDVNVPINASDSATSTVSGALLCDFELEIDPGTLAADVLTISFRESPIELDDDPSFNLNLGTYIFFPIGTVAVDGQNLVATPHTPFAPGSVSGTDFPLPPHDLRLYQGTISGVASGLAADYIDPIAVDLAVTPLVGPLGTGDGTVVLSSPVQAGSMVSYDVTMTIPVDYISTVLTDPVDVTVAADGTVSATGTLTVELPAMGPIEVLGVVAGSPAADDVTITWNSGGGAASYAVLSSPNLSTPIASWTVENPTVSNGGATSSFTDTGVLLSDDTKYYVIEAN